MDNEKVKAATTTTRSKTNAAADGPSGQYVLNIHGIGDQPPKEEIERLWDHALFGRDRGDRSRMAHWPTKCGAGAPYGNCSVRVFVGTAPPMFARMGSRSFKAPVYFTTPLRSVSSVR